MLAADIFFAFWVFALGSIVGSFLTVVAWRLPAGMSPSKPASHCPKCKHPIRWYDNVPIFGWIWLRGKCRDCEAPISIRYPVVETITGSAFLALYLLLYAGMDLETSAVADQDRIFLVLGAEASRFVFHATLLSTLIAGALIEWDQKRVPARLFLPALAVGLIAPLIWPWLRVSWLDIPLSFEEGVARTFGWTLGVLASAAWAALLWPPLWSDGKDWRSLLAACLAACCYAPEIPALAFALGGLFWLLSLGIPFFQRIRFSVPLLIGAFWCYVAIALDLP